MNGLANTNLKGFNVYKPFINLNTAMSMSVFLVSVKRFCGNMEAQISAAFSRLQPLCVRLAREHTRDNITVVMRELENIECTEVMQQLQEYVLFPLRLILKQPEQK